MKQSKQLWNKGFVPDRIIEEFTVGKDRELDLRLARYDVQGSMAHIKMLQSIGLLSKEELDMLLPALEDIAESIERGEFVIEDGVEDVHSQVEFLLTARLGDVGKKIHSGRSRNDQVLVDLKLFFRDELRNIATATERLFKRLQTLSEQHK
ncbi:MAG: argininosuccinate lyase, partial [Muribaculaceae bacterium]|nr:argininosuccinate lyase [Muribaculaceae bacterium]